MVLLRVVDDMGHAVPGEQPQPVHSILSSIESSESPPSQLQQQQQRVSPVSGAMEKQHTEAEWDAMYPHIVRLYIGEQLILSEVMRTMEARYNFKATQSMYKKRISKWQLHKYKRRSRPDNTQAHTSLKGDALVAHANMAGKRKIASIQMMYDGSGEPKDLQTAIPPRVADVAADQTTLTILLDMQAWTMSSTRPREWGLRETPAPEASELIKSASIKVTAQMYVTFSLAEALFARGEGRLAGKALRKAFLMLEAIIRRNDFGLEWALVDVLYDLAARGRAAVYRAMATHVAAVARLLLPPAHPLPRLADHLARYDGDLPTLLQRAHHSQIDAARGDPLVRRFLRAHNPTAAAAVTTEGDRRGIPSSPPPPDDDNDEGDSAAEIRAGIRATHAEVEAMKGPLLTAGPRGGGGGGGPPTLHEFVQQRTRRTAALTRGDPLLVGASDRMLFSEHNAQVAAVYALKARAAREVARGRWAEAARAQRALLRAMRERTAVDYWGIIRELWALERILVRAGGGGEEGEEELRSVRDEVMQRVTTLLEDIPDDGF
ncbi:Clr5 domain-containing protein [Biscogniauxia mediterranea]|nr:Clr5 domain-containing protein [Biscogniauxia mediterranea]